MRIIITALVLVCVFPAHTALTQAPPIPSALEKMAETERAFARRAQEVTVREAFIEFFADESIAFEPDPKPARDTLRANDRPQPEGFQLLWEPRYGDIARSGDLGYLTGPSETILPGRPVRHGNYFSVWKRQPDGHYRVILDVGGATPEKVQYALGFTRASSFSAWKGSKSKADAEKSLLEADRAFSAAIATSGVKSAYAAAFHPEAFFQRMGFLPMRSRTAAIEWFDTHVKAWSTELVKVETGASGDLGYTWGKYQMTPVEGAAYSGYYIRVWTRNAVGAWQVVAEIATPPPPAKK